MNLRSASKYSSRVGSRGVLGVGSESFNVVVSVCDASSFVGGSSARES